VLFCGSVTFPLPLEEELDDELDEELEDELELLEDELALEEELEDEDELLELLDDAVPVPPPHETIRPEASKAVSKGRARCTGFTIDFFASGRLFVQCTQSQK